MRHGDRPAHTRSQYSVEAIRHCIGLKRHEFFEYFSGLPKAFALGLSEPTQLASPIPLSKLRDMAGGFHPPQFFANVASDGPLLHVMSQALHGRPHKSPNLQRELELA